MQSTARPDDDRETIKALLHACPNYIRKTGEVLMWFESEFQFDLYDLIAEKVTSELLITFKKIGQTITGLVAFPFLVWKGFLQFIGL